MIFHVDSYLRWILNKNNARRNPNCKNQSFNLFFQAWITSIKIAACKSCSTNITKTIFKHVNHVRIQFLILSSFWIQLSHSHHVNFRKCCRTIWFSCRHQGIFKLTVLNLPDLVCVRMKHLVSYNSYIIQVAYSTATRAARPFWRFSFTPYMENLSIYACASIV